MNLDKVIENIKERAKKALEEQLSITELLLTDPIAMLMSYPWGKHIKPNQNYSQEKLHKMSYDFDPLTRFGRIVLALLLVEKHFPQAHVELGEVIEDHFEARVMKELEHETDGMKRKKLANELLSYEDHHFVLLLDDVQFDPMCWFREKLITHPKVRAYKPWNAVFATLQVLNAISVDDPNEKMSYVVSGQLVCPDMYIIKRNEIVCALGFKQKQKAEKLALALHEERPTARLMYIISKLCHRSDIFDELRRNYPPEVISLLIEEEKEVRQMIREGKIGKRNKR